MGLEIPRDRLLLAGVFTIVTGGAAMLAACAPGPEHKPSQEGFVAGLKARLRQDGMDLDSASNAQVRQFIVDKTFIDKNWLANDLNLGFLQTPARGPVQVATRAGERAPFAIDKGFIYPSPLAEFKNYTEVKLEEDIGVYIYGTLGTQSRLTTPENKRALYLFAKDFFFDSKGTRKILHLNFMPLVSGFKPLEVSDDKWVRQIESFDAAIFTDPDFASQQVLLNMNKIHVTADFFGFDPYTEAIGALVNENVNMVARSQAGKAGDIANEAPSTVFDLLSRFDPGVAKKILGENYFPFALMLEREMIELKKLSRLQMVSNFSQAKLDRRQVLFLAGLYATHSIVPPQDVPMNLKAWQFAHV